MRAERVGADTLLARIVAMVAEAQRSRAPIQRLADVVSGYFVPAVIVVAVVTFVVWCLVGPEPRLAHALVNAVAVLIIACPCALGLATPMSIMVASGRGASMGVLFRNAEAIERLGSVDTLVVDKTGTLTQGRPELVDGVVDRRLHRGDVLALAASVERRASIRWPGDRARRRGPAAWRSRRATVFESDHRPWRRGPRRRPAGGGRQPGCSCASSASTDDALARRAEALRREGQTVVFVAVDGRPAGLLGVADPIKVSARRGHSRPACGGRCGS